MDQENHPPVCTSRRDFINQVGAGFTSLALTGMLSAEDYFKGVKPKGMPSPADAARRTSKARSVIFVCVCGGVSQMET